VRLVVALVLLAGCDKLFLQKNDVPADSSIDAPLDAPPPPGCAPEFANARYLAISMQMSWPDAEKACRQLGYSFAHLAVIGDLTEAVLVDPLIGGDSWVGLTRTGEPTVYHWITKEEAGIPWYPDEPDNSDDCGRLVKGGRGVAETSWSEKRRVLCECDDDIIDRTRF
jgi:hypothetical protein